MTTNEKGFVPVMLTPFKENGAVDFEGLAALTEFYLNAGAKGLFANCQSSEMFELTPGERIQVITQVLKTANGRVPVVAAGNFGEPGQQQADFIKAVYATGVQAVIVLTSLLADKDESAVVLEQRITDLLALTGDIPLGFYECPVPYKRVLAPHLLAKFVRTGRVIYHKDTCLDIERVREKNRLCAEAPSFGLYDAYMVHAVASLRSGSAGLSCIQGNYFPELVVWLCNNYNNPGIEREVALVQQFFTDEMEVMHNHYPGSAKYYLQQGGLPVSTYTRRCGTCEISDQVKEEMKQLKIRYAEILENVPGILQKA